MWTRQLLIAAVALALAGPALAQTPPMSPSAPDTKVAPPSRSGDTAAPKPDAGAPAAASAKFLSMQKDNEQISSELVGITVVNNAGENVGKISNLIIGSDNRITGAVLSVGGFLGLGAKSVAVPWDQIKIETKDNKQVAVLAMSNEELANAPDFKTKSDVKAEAERATRAPASSPAPASPATPRR